MISKPTVFVLGAGASVNYGFPSARDLTKRICKRKEVPALVKLGFTQHLFDKFKEALHASRHDSVDAFLADRPLFCDIGKAAMAFELIKCESEQGISRDGDASFESGDWYRHLINKMRAKSYARFTENRLSVITFNYDRSFEQCFFNAINHSFGRTEGETAQLLNEMVIHVYGQLGQLPWQSNDSESVRSYEANTNPDNVKRAADGIRIIGDPTDADAIEEAQRRLKRAKLICFLGFGYRRENMEILQIAEHLTRTSIVGTCHGFSEVEKRATERDYSGLSLGHHQHKCVEFLRNCQEFLSNCEN